MQPGGADHLSIAAGAAARWWAAWSTFTLSAHSGLCLHLHLDPWVIRAAAAGGWWRDDLAVPAVPCCGLLWLARGRLLTPAAHMPAAGGRQQQPWAAGASWRCCRGKRQRHQLVIWACKKVAAPLSALRKAVIRLLVRCFCITNKTVLGLLCWPCAAPAPTFQGDVERARHTGGARRNDADSGCAVVWSRCAAHGQQSSAAAP